MSTYTVHQAKTNLSKLIEQAERGEDVVIARGDKPAVKLIPMQETLLKKTGRRPGAYKDELPEFPDSFFFDPLPDDELKLWEEGYEGDPLNQPPAKVRDETPA
ncbi:MAG: type II toxin-antitoxin system prevent-host-death family antitoxin [Hyphomicrobiales bacterium]|nr:type II toxin-antitoxin system prevent-host-death family antitoxin [Hyphomicrobiales bacterium]